MESRDGQRIYYIYGQTGVEGMVLGYKTANNAYYFDKNTLGDIISIRNQEGQIVAEYEYDAWGRILYQSGEMSDINPFRYRGYYYDQETGFYYLQTRYYDPQAMRFINADNYELIAELAQSYELNLYAYCANNPVMFTDETGEFSWFFVGLFATFVLGAGESVISQGLQYGWENINVGQVVTDGLFLAASYALSATGLSVFGMKLAGAGLSATQYLVNSLAFHNDFCVEGLVLSTGLGFFSGGFGGAGVRNAKYITSNLSGRARIGVKAIRTTIARYGQNSIKVRMVQNLYQTAIKVQTYYIINMGLKNSIKTTMLSGSVSTIMNTLSALYFLKWVR